VADFGIIEKRMFRVKDMIKILGAISTAILVRQSPTSDAPGKHLEWNSSMSG
jgi:hypothetical protein